MVVETLVPEEEAVNPLPDDVTGGVDNAFAASAVAMASAAAKVCPIRRSASASNIAPPVEVTSAPVNSASTARLFEREKRIGSW